MQRNKAFLEVEGVALWQRQLRILENLRPTEIFLAGPSRPEWKSANCIIVPDAQENAGPLAGLVAALRRSRTSLLLAFAVDLPHMTSVYLRGLLKLCQREIGVVPGARHRFEPLVAIYPKRSLAVAERFLANGSYSLQNFAASCTAHGLA